MTRSDLAAVSELEKREQASPWSPAMFRQELDASNRDYLVAEAGESIVGFAGLMTIGDEGHINTLLVEESQRRQRVASALMRSLITAAVAGGARHLTLEVRARNQSARSFYANFGFAPVGLRPRYYGDDDALIMWVHDVDHPGYLESLT